MTVNINKQARLSEHFTLGELCKTSVKTADGNIGCAADVKVYGMEQLLRYAVILLDISDESKEDFDELLLERSADTARTVPFMYVDIAAEQSVANDEQGLLIGIDLFGCSKKQSGKCSNNVCHR